MEKGYGITLGSSLRRVILSSMQGVAIESIKIEGILHEFSTLDGIYEDVPEIILNLKGVRFKVKGDFPKPVRLDVEKQGQVLASDIEVFNITKKRSIVIDINLGVVKGFSVAEEHKDSEAPIGTISIDAIYTPIKKVNFSVQPSRVGQKTDYDKLIIEIETDGSITPRETLAMSANLLIDHITLFLHPEVKYEKIEEESIDEETRKIRALLKLHVEELELSVRASNCLRNANIRFLADLVLRTEQEMLKFRNFGRKSLQELQSVLGRLGLLFGMDPNKYLTDEELEDLRSLTEEKESITQTK
jgi:DNA-directed RNA polymerase subunit alpha